MVRYGRFLRVLLAAALLMVQAVLTAPTARADGSATVERYYAESISEQTTTSASFQDAVTLTFTPPSTKYYLILASALTNNSSTSDYTETQLIVGATTYHLSQHTPKNTSLHWRSFGTHKVIQFTASTSYTIKIQYRTSMATTTTAYIKNAAIAVLEVSSTTTQYNESESESTTSLQTYQNALTKTFTASAAPYLIFSTTNNRVATPGSGKNHSVRSTFDTTTYEWTTYRDSQMSTGTVLKQTLSATSYTMAIDHKANTAGTTSAVKYPRVAAVVSADLGSSQWASDGAETSTNNTSYVNKTTLTFTPSTRGDWLIIAMGFGQQDNTSYAFQANLDVDGSSYGEFIFVPVDANLYRNFFMVRKVNLTAAEHNIRIQYKSSNASGISSIKDANILAIPVNTAESYNNTARRTEDVDNDFASGQETVYMWAHGLQASTGYMVAYYDGSSTGGGQWVATESGLTSTAYGNLSSSYYFPTNPSATAGTWRAVVFTSGSSPPTNYNDAAGTAGYVVADSFAVQQAAIPEFPTALAAAAVIAACLGSYWLARRRALGVRV